MTSDIKIYYVVDEEKSLSFSYVISTNGNTLRTCRSSFFINRNR